MTPYTDARKTAIGDIRYLHDLQQQVARLGSTECRERVRELLQLEGESAVACLNKLQYDSDIRAVVEAEPPLQAALQSAISFWRAMERNGFTECHLLRESDVLGASAPAHVPPYPPSEITGATVTDFVHAVANWIENAGRDLWGESESGGVEGPLELDRIRQELPGRYSIGDFDQTRNVFNFLLAMSQLRDHWLELTRCGNYWDTATVGAARAALIVKATQLLKELFSPPTNSIILKMLGDTQPG